MFKKRRGLSAIIGGVFVVIIISTAITYTTYTMNQMTQLAETVEAKQVTDLQRTTEEFEILKVRTDNNKFNMTVQNTGNFPIHLNRMWIENTTDSTWPIGKYDLDFSLAPGNATKNIGQNLDLFALDSQSYQVQLVTDRGNSKQVVMNSVGTTSLYLRLTATPAVMPTTFSTTVTLEVINTGTTQLVNLQPNMVAVTTPVCNSCSFVEEQSATPSSFDSLDPGDTAIFEWVYSFEGDNNDTILFEAGILNDVRTDTFTVALQTIESALNADIALESGGVGDQSLLGDDVLIFHEETTATSGGTAYQMYSGSPDGGDNGDRISLHNEIPHFFTNNGSQTITVPAGDWDIAMQLKSQAVVDDTDSNFDMIFHFEDGLGNDPDNSEGDSSRDLAGCGANEQTWQVTADNNDAEEDDNGNMSLYSGDLEFPEETNGDENTIGLRYTGINLVEDTVINSAYLDFYPDASDSGTIYTRIYGELHENSPAFGTGNSDISGRTKTTAYVDWTISSSWSQNTRSAATVSPNLASIVQEIVNQEQWESGDSIVFIIERLQNSSQREGKPHDDDDWNDDNTTELTINWGQDGHPDWETDQGPHGSGVFRFDGTSQCFLSSNTVSSSDGNNIGDNHVSTGLWFKTDGNDQVTTEQILFEWVDDNTCPDCEHYRLSLTGNPNGGKLLFSYSPRDAASSTVTCQSTNEYDDENWYYVIVHKDSTGSYDDCDLRIYDTTGTQLEEIHVDDNVQDQNVQVDGTYWSLGADNDGEEKFFKGWIDDLIHWDDNELNENEMDAVARTNYGNGAHKFDLTLDLTDQDGDFVSNIYTSVEPLTTKFADSKNGGNNDDWAYSQVNMTMALSEVVIGANQRLDLYFDWEDDEAGVWEALEVEMKIDDTSMNNPYPSFMQIPYPDNPFPTYYVHDNDDEFKVFVSNTGVDGIFMTYQGTRVNFNGTNGAFAGIVDSVNGTSGDYVLSEDRDSIHIPAGELGEVWFHQATDIPSNDESGTKPSPGLYTTTVWIQGYSDRGETFTRSVVIGTVEIVE